MQINNGSLMINNYKTYATMINRHPKQWINTKGISLFLLLFFSFNMIQAQQHGLDWVLHGGNAERDVLNDMTLDSLGNSYCIGSFAGSFAVDGSDKMPAKGNRDAFIMKTDKNGKYLWSSKLGSEQQDYACRIKATPKTGVYVIGGASKGADAGKQKNVNPVNCLYVSFFSAKGELKWIKYFESSLYNHFTSMTTAPDQSVYVSGCVYDSISIEGQKIVGKNSGTVFIAKFSQAGDLQWLNKIEGTGMLYPAVLATDDQSTLWVGGHYTDNLQIDSLKLSVGEAGKTGIFALELDADGHTHNGWTIAKGDGAKLGAMVADTSGRVYLAGSFTQRINIQGDTLQTVAGNQAIFLTAIDSTGRVGWAKKIDGTRNTYLETMAQDRNSNLLIGLAASSDIQIGTTTIAKKSAFDDIALVSISSVGRCLWAEVYGGKGEDFPNKLEIDHDGNILMAATFQEDLPLTDGKTLTSYGEPDFILAKIIDCSNRNIKIKGDTIFCQGSSLLLSASQADCKTYSWNNGLSADQQLNINQAGVYTLEVVDKSGCLLKDSIRVRISPLPIFSLGKDTSIFSLQSLRIKPDSLYQSQQWSDGSYNANYTLVGSSVPLGKHDIWMQATDRLGCVFTDSIAVEVKPVNFKSAQALDTAKIFVSPNPASDYIHYSINMSFKHVQIRLVDITGQVYRIQELYDYIENTEYSFNLDGIREGAYTFKVYSEGVVRSEGLIVRRGL